MDATSKRRSAFRLKAGTMIAALSSTAMLVTGLAGTPAIAQGGTGTGPGITAPTALSPVTVTITRSATTTPVTAGTELVFELKVTNPNSETIWVEPGDSNLTNFAPRCRWRKLGAGQSFPCPDVKHVVTQDEVTAGAFIPRLRFDIKDATGQNVLVQGQEIAGAPIALSNTPPPPPASGEPFTITWTRTDTLGDKVYKDDVLAWRIRVQNNRNEAVVAFPSASNLQGVLTTNTKNCRWDKVAANASFECHTLSYRVTDQDVTKGSFTPSVTFKATSDRDGKNLIQNGTASTGTPVTVSTGTRRDPLETPTDRVDGESIILATRHTGGFDCPRIPALTTAPNGWLLAAWDGRPPGCGDAPNPNSIVQRISKDGGRSWSPVHIVAEGKAGTDKYGYSDPSYVVDHESKKIFMFFVKSFNQGFGGSRAGTDPNDRNVLHAAVMESSDNGETWTTPTVITQAITPDPSWRSRFAASGEGIQKQHAPHKGRLVQQYTIINGSGALQAVSVYSDDHGQTWQAGQPFGTGMDENKVVELENGDLMVNSRSSSSIRARLVAISKDGGQTYSAPTVQTDLIDPRNNASIIRAFPDAPPGSLKSKVLLFTNAKSTSSRVNGHVSVSLDNGKTWSASKQFQPDSMAYSTITNLRNPDGTLIEGKYGILYERPTSLTGYTNVPIHYMQISWDWLGIPLVDVSGEDRDAQRGVLKMNFTVTNHESTPIDNAVLRPDPIPGWTWRTPAVTVPRIEPNQTVRVEAVAEVGALQNEGAVPVTATIDLGNGRSLRGGLTAMFKLLPNQQPASCSATGLSLKNEAVIPFQPGEEPSKMFDGDPNTLWHTPYNSQPPLTFPLNLDFGFVYKAGIEALVLTPRPSGANGKLNEVKVSLVKNGQETELIAAHRINDNGLLDLSALKNHVADGEDVTVRVAINSTLGDTENKWASLGEACVFTVDTAPITHDETAPVTPPPSGSPGSPIVPGPVPSPSDETRPSGNVVLERLSGASRVETSV
ncbi:exo-alpha-sialidase, partial [Stomatohabitans albus]